MNLTESFLTELQQEAKNTRKMLSRVPYDNPAWKPHEKSMPIGDLASHIAEISSWINETMEKDELDFAAMNYTPVVLTSTDELLAFFDKTLDHAVKCFKSCSGDDALMPSWTLRSGDQIYFTMPKHLVIRNMVLNHIVHHRAQLSVYLRLLGIAVPGMYGPTADES
jgi:uncharacterized damage-inducible protein DinB